MNTITEATEKDWENFWYESESEGKDVEQVYDELVRKKFEGEKK